MQKEIIKIKEAIIYFFMLISILILGIGVLKTELQVVLLFSLFFTIGYSMYKGYSFEFILNCMSKSIINSYEALIIFILIGGIIGMWILSGTIPSLIYYGLSILSPKIFLPVGLLVCSLTSVVLGTSWGTISTVGIALIGIGETIGIPLPITCGMIVSGAFFGDKISPMSDTTNLVAVTTDTKLHSHISSMLYTTIPAYLISLLMYTIIGLNYIAININSEKINLIKNILSSKFEISLITFLPIIIVIILNFLKKPTIITMFIGIILGGIVSIFIQGSSLKETLEVINFGYTNSTNIEIVDKIILRGGIQSMMYTFSLTFLALSLGGILSEIGYLRIIIESLLKKIKRIGSLISFTIFSCFISNLILGEAYLTIILNANLYKDEYKKRGLKTSMLSRTLEEGGTLTTGLIPWTTAGAFIGATLPVSALGYLPFTFFNLVNIAVSIIFSYLGIFVLKNKKND